MASETQLIYAVEGIAIDGSPTLDLYRRPDVLDLDYETVKSWGVIATGSKPDFVWFRGDLYCVGGFSRVLVRHRSESVWRAAGIRQPTDFLSVVEGVGAGGSPGQCLAYTTFIHKQGARLLAESNPSNVVELPDQTGKGYVWTLQSTTAEARVTQVRGYRSMNGGNYRLAFEVPYGTTTFTENVKTNQLLQTGPSGHYIPPYGVSFAAKAFGRMWYARTNEYGHRLWGSQGGLPQYVPLTNFRDTDDRETITGLAKSRDVLIVFCLNSTYILRKHGSSGFDFTLQKIDSAVGCTSHWAIREIHNKLWFPSTDGVWLYDGGLRFAMEDVRNFYRADYEANRDSFKEAFAIDDRTGKNYLLFTPRPSKLTFGREPTPVGTVCYVGNYVNFEPSIGGENAEPDWSLDLYERIHTSAVYSEIGETIIASEDFAIRQFDEENDDDDGDTLQKHMVILTGHQLFMDPGDDINSAKTFKPYYAHMESEFNAWTVSLLGGDEAAARGIAVDNLNTWWKNDIAASEHWDIVGTPPALAKFVPKSVHFMVPEKVSGRGLTGLYEAVLTKKMSFRGFGGWYEPGPATRGPEVLGSAVGGDFTVTPQFENVWTDLPVSKLVAQGFDWNLRLEIAGVPVGTAWVVMEVTKPSGEKEVFPYRVEDGDWSDPYQTPGEVVTLELGVNVVTGYIVDSTERSGVGSEDFTMEVGIAGPTVYVECGDDPGVPKEGADVDLYIDTGSGLNLYDQKTTDVNGLVSWATIPSATTEIRVEGNADCGLDSEQTVDWSTQIDLFLESE